MADVVSLNDLLPKPAYLDPCNGCGGCCLMAQCSVSLVIFGKARGVCPALERTGEKTFGCGLMSRPQDFLDLPAWGHKPFAEAVAVMLGAGNGCDAPTEAEWSPAGTEELLRRARVSFDRASEEAKVIMTAIGARRP